MFGSSLKPDGVFSYENRMRSDFELPGSCNHAVVLGRCDAHPMEPGKPVEVPVELIEDQKQAPVELINDLKAAVGCFQIIDQPLK